MKLHHLGSCAWLLLVLAAATTLDAQISENATARLRLKQTIRVRASALEPIEGRLRASDVVGLTVATSRGTVTSIRWETLDSLWVRRHPVRNGAIIGGIVGLTPVLLTCGQAIDECGLIPYGILIPAAGAVLGSFVGAVFPKWKRLYP